MSLLTWSPFQSPEVREICRHMTREELDESLHRGAKYGVWAGISIGLPMKILSTSESWGAWSIAVALLVAHAAIIPVWLRGTRQFLASTEWAQAQRYPTDLRLFSFRSRPQTWPNTNQKPK